MRHPFTWQMRPSLHTLARLVPTRGYTAPHPSLASLACLF